MSFAHKLSTYDDTPHKKIVFCVYCGQEDDLSGPCPGEYKMSAEGEALFKEIFDKPVTAPKKNKNFVSGLL